ncbi:MAG TPA: mandelate racemase, partial [Burkholderiales bacterium]
MKLTIKNIRARAVQAPLKRPPRSASGEIPNAALVLIDIETSEGITGSSYLFAFMRSMLKPTVAMVDALAEMIVGDALVPLDIEAKLRKRLTLQDSHGIAGQVIAGIDMAIWDAYAKSLGVPLVCALGGKVQPVRAYNSCGLWIKDPALLADEAAQLVAEGGYNAVKL